MCLENESVSSEKLEISHCYRVFVMFNDKLINKAFFQFNCEINCIPVPTTNICSFSVVANVRKKSKQNKNQD